MNKLNSATDAAADIECDDILYPSVVPFVLVHLACFAAIWTGVKRSCVKLTVATRSSIRSGELMPQTLISGI